MFIVEENKNQIDLSQINELFKKVGWGETYYTKEKWQSILVKTSFFAFIKQENNFVAYGRIVEDGVMCMFYDICVDPLYQGQQLGTKLMQFLIKKIKNHPYESIGLFLEDNSKNLANFYQKLGFEFSLAMELKKYMKN